MNGQGRDANGGHGLEQGQRKLDNCKRLQRNALGFHNAFVKGERAIAARWQARGTGNGYQWRCTIESRLQITTRRRGGEAAIGAHLGSHCLLVVCRDPLPDVRSASLRCRPRETSHGFVVCELRPLHGQGPRHGEHAGRWDREGGRRKCSSWYDDGRRNESPPIKGQEPRGESYQRATQNRKQRRKSLLLRGSKGALEPRQWHAASGASAGVVMLANRESRVAPSSSGRLARRAGWIVPSPVIRRGSTALFMHSVRITVA